ncbi:hypothetical protein [Mucilaginibacter mallensis]|uniref:hypothetical protein n=1 Tax=Mucilaginibacter mallensis TaxID=652787 RepID=UPI000B8A2003|nr:hypothetical protein [Mucilaginibacter mallensis]
MIQKKQKIKSAEMLLYRTKPLRCKSGKTWAAIFLPPASPLMPHASVKICYALPLRKATIVLPDFTRSCSTDGGRSLTETDQKSVGPDNKGGPA